MKVLGIMVSGQSAALRAVLVVEDEMMLRMRAVDMVEDAGFAAVEAINADDALAILQSRSDIELLFTDIQMPGSMDGLKLAFAVHERWPAIKSRSRCQPGRSRSESLVPSARIFSSSV